MAGVTDRISSLPGSFHSVPDGMTCDDCGKPATHRVQGETDSFGSEMNDFCAECYKVYCDEVERYRDERGPQACDWCKKESTDLRHARDYDEGMAGPVYEVCGECIRRRNEEARLEMEEYDRDHGYDDWDDSGDDERYEPVWNEAEFLKVFADDAIVYPAAVPTMCKRCKQHWANDHKCKPTTVTE